MTGLLGSIKNSLFGAPADAPLTGDAARGREEHAAPQHYHASGRGGAGNIGVSPARPVSDESKEDIARARAAVAAQYPHEASGAGRGGFGNIAAEVEGAAARAAIDNKDEAAVRKAYEERHTGDHVAHGRGGAGNIGH